MEEQAALLRRLLVHLENKEAEERESEDGLLAEEFSRLKMQSIQYRNENTYPSQAALIKDNVKKNRYKDIVPFDHTRVKLSLSTSRKDEDYINASFIKGVSGSNAYIATQGPLPHTVLDFLRMIWEYEIQVVVMACREFEMGRRKCERYWPETQTDQFVCGPFTIHCDSDENKGDYRTRKLRITYQNCSRAIRQLHYVNWPDHGVPDSIPPILEMLQEMRVCQDHDDTPICIHCSAGCGRTGVLCAIDYTWNLVKRQTVPEDFSINDLVQHMRTQRPSVVQTKEQYELVYKTVKFLFEKYLQSFDTPACQNQDGVQLQPAASPSPAASAIQTSDRGAESQSDWKPPSQCWLDPEAQSPRLTAAEELVQPQPLSPAQEKVLAQSKRDDGRWMEGEQEEEQQQQPQQLHHHHHQHHHNHYQHHHQPTIDLSQTPSEAVTPAQPPNHTGLGLRPSEEEEEERTERDDSEPPPKPTLPLLATACLTVEDPYFESPEGASSVDEPLDGLMEVFHFNPAPTLTLNDQSVALDNPCSEHPESGQRLEVIIPPNAAALAVREMGGSPPSPAPPLPERTPESFELADVEALVERCTSSQPVGLDRVGVSSEWCCDSLTAPATQRELKSWTRSKSLNVSMTSTDDLNPPLPHRTPESFILATEEVTADENGGALLLGLGPGPRIGTSSEWAGSSQPKRFLDYVFTNRSKSVRAKSSTQASCAVVRQLAPPTVVFSGAGSGAEQQVDSRVSSETSEDKTLQASSNGKVMPRTRSLKFFKSRSKSKPATPPPPPPAPPGQQPPPTKVASSSGFKFGFGNRFMKPKGPRSYPEPWM